MGKNPNKQQKRQSCAIIWHKDWHSPTFTIRNKWKSNHYAGNLMEKMKQDGWEDTAVAQLQVSWEAKTDASFRIWHSQATDVPASDGLVSKWNGPLEGCAMVIATDKTPLLHQQPVKECSLEKFTVCTMCHEKNPSYWNIEIHSAFFWHEREVSWFVIWGLEVCLFFALLACLSWNPVQLTSLSQQNLVNVASLSRFSHQLNLDSGLHICWCEANDIRFVVSQKPHSNHIHLCNG